MKPKFLIIHCSASYWGDAETIKKWHTDPKPKGNGWNDIGYHYVICNGYDTYFKYQQKKSDSKVDGLVQKGRSEDMTGAHATGYNNCSLGICLVGVNRFTDKQLENLKTLIRTLSFKYNIAKENILGHYETESGSNQGKTCPNIDMKKFRRELHLDNLDLEG